MKRIVFENETPVGEPGVRTVACPECERSVEVMPKQVGPSGGFVFVCPGCGHNGQAVFIKQEKKD